MASILDKIVEQKWIEIAAARATTSAEQLERLAVERPPGRDFGGALRQPGMRIITEVKKASPSAGLIRADFDPVAVARTYAQHGADCISVLTDEHFFQGHLDFLTRIRAAVDRPLLRKDFILDRYQLLQARFAGADAVLLIAEILPGERLGELYREALALGLQVLMELHDAEQLPRVLETGAPLIGINNRDLRTFETRLDQTLRLREAIPGDRCVVSESGIKTHADLARLEAAGVDAVLVGESLMRAGDIGSALDELRAGAR
jgi:indole-3-glycerol phosphate synthase